MSEFRKISVEMHFFFSFWLVLFVRLMPLMILLNRLFMNVLLFIFPSSSSLPSLCNRHVQVETSSTMSSMRKHLERIRFRGQKRDELLDLGESPNTSDTECPEEAVVKPRHFVRESEEIRELDGEQQSESQVPKSHLILSPRIN